jgi:hypothetical protein
MIPDDEPVPPVQVSGAVLAQIGWLYPILVVVPLSAR